jgi:hypothetical protein
LGGVGDGAELLTPSSRAGTCVLMSTLLKGVPPAAGERRIGAPQVPVELRDAERITRNFEEPCQLLVERPAR